MILSLGMVNSSCAFVVVPASGLPRHHRPRQPPRRWRGLRRPRVDASAANRVPCGSSPLPRARRLALTSLFRRPVLFREHVPCRVHVPCRARGARRGHPVSTSRRQLARSGVTRRRAKIRRKVASGERIWGESGAAERWERWANRVPPHFEMPVMPHIVNNINPVAAMSLTARVGGASTGATVPYLAHRPSP